MPKATLENLETHEVFECRFNPTDFTVEKSNTISATAVKGKNVPKSEFGGGGARTLNLKLLFDVSESPTESLIPRMEKLQKLMLVAEETANSKSKRGRPPRVQFKWGTYMGFPALITKLSIQYTLFREDGSPIRSVVTMGLQEFEDKTDKPKQNPTSFTESGQKLRYIRPHETLASLAWEEYQDPTQWRRIADANRMENPRDLSVGQVIVIPPR